MVPDGANTFLDLEGNGVMSRYDDVDWNGLARTLQARLAGDEPKSIKVHVANDGHDIFDTVSVRLDHLDTLETESDFGSRTVAVLPKVSMANYRNVANFIAMNHELSDRQPGGAHVGSGQIHTKRLCTCYFGAQPGGMRSASSGDSVRRWQDGPISPRRKQQSSCGWICAAFP